MKFTAVLLLAIVLIIAAGCGRGTEEQEGLTADVEMAEATTITEIATSEEATTTEAPTILAPSYVAKEVSWRFVDLDKSEGTEINTWLVEYRKKKEADYEATRNEPPEYPMGKRKTVFEDARKIILRDNKTGKETILLEGNDEDGEMIRVPHISKVLDNRYFTYFWGGWEWWWGMGVYDTHTMMELPINCDEFDSAFYFYDIRENYLYLNSEFGPYGLLKIDLRKLDQLVNGELIPTNALANIPDVEEISGHWLPAFSDNSRYFVVNDVYQYVWRIYDLWENKLVLRLYKPDLDLDMDESVYSEYLVDMVFRDNNTLYCYNRMAPTAENESLALEITLP